MQFEDEVEMTENGDCYATVISGCLAYLLRKERIIELLTNETEIAMMYGDSEKRRKFQQFYCENWNLYQKSGRNSQKKSFFALEISNFQ